jgi:hypothetical protein
VTKSIPQRPGVAAACILGIIALAGPACGETIYSLSDGAACRDKNGVVETPRSAPHLAAPAEMTPFGMIRVTGGWNNQDCYFYMSEVNLEAPGTTGLASCPTAAVGQEKARLAGTRGLDRGCSR